MQSTDHVRPKKEIEGSAFPNIFTGPFQKRYDPQNHARVSRPLLSPFIFLSILLLMGLSCKERDMDPKKDEGFGSSPISGNTVNEYQNTAQTDTIGTGQLLSKEDIVDYLNASGLIGDPKNYTVQLTNQALFIDGNKQSKEVHGHIMKNFVKYPNRRLSTTFSVSTD